MNKPKAKKAFTLTEILIVIGIIVMLAAIALPNLLRARLNSNERLAIARLKTIGTAAEEYAGRFGSYPSSLNNLTQANPPYLTQDAVTATMNGYNITCTWQLTEYNCTATPTNNETTGIKIFRITTGIKLVESSDEGVSFTDLGGSGGGGGHGVPPVSMPQ